MSALAIAGETLRDVVLSLRAARYDLDDRIAAIERAWSAWDTIALVALGAMSERLAAEVDAEIARETEGQP